MDMTRRVPATKSGPRIGPRPSSRNTNLISRAERKLQGRHEQSRSNTSCTSDKGQPWCNGIIKFSRTPDEPPYQWHIKSDGAETNRTVDVEECYHIVTALILSVCIRLESVIRNCLVILLRIWKVSRQIDPIKSQVLKECGTFCFSRERTAVCHH
jgi:hypothetical protein